MAAERWPCEAVSHGTETISGTRVPSSVSWNLRHMPASPNAQPCARDESAAAGNQGQKRGKVGVEEGSTWSAWKSTMVLEVCWAFSIAPSTSPTMLSMKDTAA